MEHNDHSVAEGSRTDPDKTRLARNCGVVCSPPRRRRPISAAPWARGSSVPALGSAALRSQRRWTACVTISALLSTERPRPKSGRRRGLSSSSRRRTPCPERRVVSDAVLGATRPRARPRGRLQREPSGPRGSGGAVRSASGVARARAVRSRALRIEHPPFGDRSGGGGGARSTRRPRPSGPEAAFASSRGRLPAPMERASRSAPARALGPPRGAPCLVRPPFLTWRTYFCRFAPFCCDLVLIL